MTLSLKGFITNNTTVNNTPNQIARFGELSTFCRTFAKDVQLISNSATPDVGLSVFSHRLTSNTTQIKLNHVFSDMLVEFANWLYSTAQSFTANTTQVDVVAAITNRFPNVSSVTVSKLVGDTVTGLYMPTRVAMTFTTQGYDPLEAVVWTANAEFETGYDEYEIVVVPPLDNIDVFLSNYAAVTEALGVVNPPRDMQRIESAAAKKPQSHLVATPLNWVDPTQATRKVSTSWYTLIYGPRGNTTDAINDALRAFILSRSTSTEANWRVIMPDLFRVSRFLLVPNWTEIAIQGRTGSIAAIYSPVNSSAAVAAAALTISANIGIKKTTWESLAHPFRCLNLTIFPGEDNRADALSLRQAVPDYIGVESTHEDFNRQALTTQEFSNLLGTLVRSAENYQTGATQEIGVRVIKFDTYTCLAAKFDNVEYIIRTKRQD